MKATNAPGGANIPKNRINNTAAPINVKAIFLSNRFRRFCFNNHPPNGNNEEAVKDFLYCFNLLTNLAGPSSDVGRCILP